MAGRRVHVVMDAGLVERIDEALRGESRGEFVRRAVERALAFDVLNEFVGDGVPLPGEQSEPTPKPVSQKPRSEPLPAVGFRRGPRQDFSPQPKGKS